VTLRGLAVAAWLDAPSALAPRGCSAPSWCALAETWLRLPPRARARAHRRQIGAGVVAGISTDACSDARYPRLGPPLGARRGGVRPLARLGQPGVGAPSLMLVIAATLIGGTRCAVGAGASRHGGAVLALVALTNGLSSSGRATRPSCWPALGARRGRAGRGSGRTARGAVVRGARPWSCTPPVPPSSARGSLVLAAGRRLTLARPDCRALALHAHVHRVTRASRVTLAVAALPLVAACGRDSARGASAPSTAGAPGRRRSGAPRCRRQGARSKSADGQPTAPLTAPRPHHPAPPAIPPPFRADAGHWWDDEWAGWEDREGEPAGLAATGARGKKVLTCASSTIRT
jgi:hypothetical protein